MKFAITPVDCWNGPATHIDLVDTTVILGSGLNTEWTLKNAAGDIVSSRNRGALTEEQYKMWVGGDEHVARSIAENVGLAPLVVEDKTVKIEAVSDIINKIWKSYPANKQKELSDRLVEAASVDYIPAADVIEVIPEDPIIPIP